MLCKCFKLTNSSTIPSTVAWPNFISKTIKYIFQVNITICIFLSICYNIACSLCEFVLLWIYVFLLFSWIATHNRPDIVNMWSITCRQCSYWIEEVYQQILKSYSKNWKISNLLEKLLQHIAVSSLGSLLNLKWCPVDRGEAGEEQFITAV